MSHARGAGVLAAYNNTRKQQARINSIVTISEYAALPQA